MKILNIIAWASGGAGAIFILLGAIAGLFHMNILRLAHFVNYFAIANTFFLVMIALFIYLYRCQCKKD